jgi:type II secretory pathway pseudopilin PulG
MTTPRKNCAGFTLLEGAVAAAVIGVLVATFIARALFYYDEAERVVAAQLIATMRTALQVRVAQTIATEGEGALASLVALNPLALLHEKPQNYLGEFDYPRIEEMPRASWFYDRTDHSLVYLPNSHKSFSFSTSELLRFKVKFAFLPSPSDSSLSQATKGIVLDQVTDRLAVTQ